MRTSVQVTIRLTALAMVSILGGCLTSEDSGTDGTPEPSEFSDSAPTISGTPSTSVLMGAQYTFTQSALDADNDPVTSDVQGEPYWLSINFGGVRVLLQHLTRELRKSGTSKWSRNHYIRSRESLAGNLVRYRDCNKHYSRRKCILE
jgi:hypothetical protein